MTDSSWTDISVALRTGMISYPGDPVVRTILDYDLNEGDAFTHTSLTLSAHSGTHIDSPRHFIKGGQTIDAISFDAVNGRARVIGIADKVSIKVTELEVHNILAGEIVLFRTGNSALWGSDTFHEDYVYLSTDAAAYLVARKVKSVGIDYLSVGGYKKNELEVHRMLLDASIWIIESLDLSGIEPGAYDLACLPLKIEGCEAAPARAFVRAAE
jgi:arylformamidase